MTLLKQVKYRRLLWILLAAPFFKPALFDVMEELTFLETLFDLWRLAATCCICIVYLYAMVRRKLRPSPVLLALGAYLLFIGLSTVLNAHNYWTVINHIITIGCFCMLLEVSLQDGPDMTLDMLYYPLTALILSNFILLCIYPLGIALGGTYGYSYNLMGIDNFLPPVLLPYICLAALRSTMLYGDLDWSFYVMLGVVTLSLLFIWCATGLMGLAVVLLFLLFFYKRRGQILFNGLMPLLMHAGMFFGIVLLRLQNLFAFLIEGVLHKGLSFTGRTDIWDEALRNIVRQPLLGYGLAQSGKVYRLSKHKYYHAHNIFLEILMEGGILALISYVVALGISCNRLFVWRKHTEACILAAGLLSCAVMTSMEPFLDNNGLLIYGLMILSYHVDKFILPEFDPISA